MNHKRGRLISSILSSLILISMLMSMVLPFGLADRVQAQEATVEPPVATPVEQPTDVPTDAPAEQPTDAPTEPPITVPAETTQDPSVIPDVEQTEPSVVVIEPEDPEIYVDDFEDGDTNGWVLSAGWALVPTETNTTLSTIGAFETATISGLNWDNLSVTADFGISEGNTANIAFRVASDNYNVTIGANGQVSLYQGLTLLASGIAPTEIAETYTVNVQAFVGIIVISVNGVPQISQSVVAPLPAGSVIFSTGASNTGLVTLDNVSVQQLDAPPIAPIIPTQIPTEEPVVVIVDPTEIPVVIEPPVVEGTEEPVAETTEEAVVEVTEEPVAETTEEAVVEGTEEPIAETTEEAHVAEGTEEPVAETTEEAPVAEGTEEPVAETTEEAPIAEDVITAVLADDFEAENDVWSFDEGAGVVAGEENGYASLAPNTGMQPASNIFLVDMQLDVSINLVATDASDGAEATEEAVAPINGVNINFHVGETGAYTLAFEAGQSVLYRNAEVVVSTASAHATDTWHTISISVVGGEITVSVNDVVELTFADETALAGGTIVFTAQADNGVQVDNVAVYDLAPASDTAETPVPFTLTEENSVKLAGVLYGLLTTYLDGDLDGALATANDFFLDVDEQNRIRVAIWAEDGQTGATIAPLIENSGGTIVNTYDEFVETFVSFDSIIELVNLSEISTINMPETLVSTSNAFTPNMMQVETQNSGGTVVPHSLDHIGANSWHELNIKGFGVDILVIDTGFSTANHTLPEQDCLANSSPVNGVGGNSHGINVVQVICDIAPDSRVFMYRVSNTTDIVNAINSAVNIGYDLVLITVDGAGGSGGVGGDPSGIDGAITAAYTANIPVIASAGNAGLGGAVPFAYSGGESNLRIQASGGAVITYSWEEPQGETNYPSTMSVNDTIVDSRTTRTGEANHQYVVPSSCGDSCEVVLHINGTVATNMMVRVVGGQSGNTIQGSDGGMTAQATVNHTQLTSAADAEHSIAVGAVCTDQVGVYPLADTSSVGNNPQPNNALIKPEIVAPSYVQTSISGAPDCNTSGFGGTSASAAHTAGMAALLFSNSQNASMFSWFNGGARPDRLEAYLMTHAIDLLTPGFDYETGAGMAVLGDPNYNINEQFNYTEYPTDANGLISYNSSNTYFVGVANINSSQSGDQFNPFISPSYAIQQAIANGRQYIVFQPGEYVSSWDVPDPGAGSLTLISYDGADLVNRLDSHIWVVDTYEGQGGITIGAFGFPVQNVSIIGFQFEGASPEYLSNAPAIALADISPINVTNSSNITIEGNTFLNFDRPLVIDSSDNVTIMDNVFDSFVIKTEVDELTGASTPRYSATAIQVFGLYDDSTVYTVTIEGNSFINNYVERNTSIPKMEAIIQIERMEADLFRNRFENNTASSVITIDQWVDQILDEKVLEEVVVYSSLFNNNDLFGPLIHLYQGANFRFVNNSVVNHILSTSPSLGLIVGVGGSNTQLFSDISDHQWDIHNNLFFNTRAALVGDVATGFFLNCSAIDGGVNDGARYNWFIQNSLTGGDCDSAIDGGSNTPINNNIYTFLNLNDSVAVETFRDATFFMDGDPENPYRLLPDLNDLENSADLLGIDDGFRPFVEAIMGVTYDLNNLHFDVMGLPRMVDPSDLVTPIDGASLVDIGAYELSEPEPVSLVGDGTVNVAAIEDQNVIAIALDTAVEGGFRPYNFTLSNLPTIYDTNPLNACGGQPINYDPVEDRYTAFYCPPEDFYTVGAPAGFELNFTYTASGQLVPDVTPLATININISPVDDGSPTRYTSDENELQVIFTDLSSPINYRLAPYVDIVPTFAFSDPDADDDAGTRDDTDYGFTLSSYSVDTGASGYNADLFGGVTPNTAIANAVDGNGYFMFEPARGVAGAIEFTYNVQDRDGQTGNRRVRIVVTPRLADIGLHDDTSLDFVYSNNWTPYYIAGAVNNTVHYASINNSYTDFYFVGDSFVLDLTGWGTAATQAPQFQVLLDPDDTGAIPQATHNTFGELTCTSNSATVTGILGDFIFACSGIESIPDANGQLHRLRIQIVNPTNLGRSLALDAISVRGIGLPAGYFEETDFAVSYTGTWTVGFANTATAGGSYSFSNDPSGRMNFKIDGNRVDTMVIYRSVASFWAPMDVYINGVFRQRISNYSTVSYSNQPAVITGIGGGLNQIEIRSTGTNGYFNIEAIELFAPTAALNPGTYIPEDPRVNMYGNWVTYTGAGPSDGKWSYNQSLTGSMSFNINGNGVTIYRGTNTGYGNMEVCVGTVCQIVVNSYSPFAYGVPITVRSNTNGLQTVTIKSTDGGVIAIDSIQVLGAQLALSPGYYDINDSNLRFSAGWQIYGITKYTTNTSLPGTLQFNVDATQMGRLVIHYQNWVGTYQVCGPTPPCQSISVTANSAAPGYRIFSKTDLGLTGTNDLVTITAQFGTTAIIGIEILGPSVPLTPGYYEERDFNFTYSGSWTSNPVTNGSRDGTLRYTSPTAGQSMSFRVNATQVDRMVVYFASYGGTLRVTANGINFNIVQTTANFPLGRNYRVIDLQDVFSISGTDHLITITNLSGYASLEAIQLLASPATLGVGSYQETDSGLEVIGNWYNSTGTLGPLVYSNETTAARIQFRINTATVKRIAVYHDVWGGGVYQYRICANNGGNCVVRTQSSTRTVISISELSATDPTEDITIEVVSGYTNIDRIELLGAATALTPGHYEESHADITTNGPWTSLATTLGNGTLVYTNNTALSTTMTFNVNATQMDRIVINHTNWLGNLQICGVSCQTVIQNSNVAQSVATFTKSSLGITGANEPITIRSLGGAISIESIDILAPQQVLGNGTYEENNANFTFQRGWQNYATTNDANSKLIGTGDLAAQLSFRINGTQVEFITINHAGWGGTMHICNVGGSCQDVVQTGSTFTIATDALGATDADETITISTALNWISIKSIVLRGTPTALSAGHYEETNANVVSVGNWTSYATTSLDNTLIGTNITANTSLTFNVNASAIDRISINQAGWVGVMSVSAQGGNTIQPTQSGANPILITTTALGIPSGNHLITITVASGYISIESIDLYAPAGPLGLGYYEEVHPDLNYTGNWTNLAVAGLGNGKVVYNNDLAADLTFTVNTGVVQRIMVHHTNWIGTLRVCGNVCATVVQTGSGAATGRYSTFTSTQLDLAGSSGLVTIDATGGTIGIGSIELLGAQTVVTTGSVYQETNHAVFSYTGAWVNLATTGGTLRFTNSTTSNVSFVVNADVVNYLIINQAGWGGNAQLCNGGDCSTGVQGSTAQVFNISSYTGNVTLTLRPVTVSDYIAVDSIEGLASLGDFEPGFYQQDNAFVSYNTGTWTRVASTLLNGGSGAQSNNVGASFSFDVTNTTGFVLYLTTGTSAYFAPINVCWTRQSDSAETCQNGVNVATAATTYMNGRGFFGLQETETYTVVVTHAGTGAQYLSVDAIGVLAPTTQTLELGVDGAPVIYDGNNSALIYGPAPLWSAGPATGFYGNTYNWATNAGAVIQVEIEANSATVYWYRSTGSSSNINFCMVIEGVAANELQCNNFSLYNGVTDTDAPITLYGFGFGEHELIFENRTPGRAMSLDAIELR